jgi:hypothetical protein
MVKIMLMMLNMMVVASFGWMVGWAPVGEIRGAYERANEGPLLKSI